MDSRTADNLFRKRVYAIVAMVPKGKVVTYGEVALLAGLPRAAREVGWIAHTGPSNLPWQRVVNRFGGLAKGYPGSQLGHKIDLEKDGVEVREDLTVDLQRCQWWPDRELVRRLALPPEMIDEINRKIPFSKDKLSVRGRRLQIKPAGHFFLVEPISPKRTCAEILLEQKAAGGGDSARQPKFQRGEDLGH